MATLESQPGDEDYSMLVLRVGLGTLLTTSLLTIFLLVSFEFLCGMHTPSLFDPVSSFVSAVAISPCL